MENEPQIEKASDTEIKVTTSQEQVIPLKQLKRQKQNLVERKTAIEARITEVDALISQAEDLGVVETVTE